MRFKSFGSGGAPFGHTESGRDAAPARKDGQEGMTALQWGPAFDGRALDLRQFPTNGHELDVDLPGRPEPDRDSVISYDIIADGLANPRGLSFGPGGDLYVLETGTGGEDGTIGEDGKIIPFLPDYISLQYGETAAIAQISLNGWGGQAELIDGLPSLREFYVSDGAGRILSVGSNDLAISGDGTAYVVTGSGLTIDTQTRLGEDGDSLGTILKIEGLFDDEPGEEVDALFDFVAYEALNNPDANETTFSMVSNPYAIAQMDGMLAVADSGGNAVYWLEDDGLTLLGVTVLPARDRDPSDAPPPPPPGEGGEGPGGFLPPQLESVPTSVAVGPDGALYVGELTGVPQPDGAARVWRIEGPDADPEIFAEGFSQIIDIGFDRRGTMFVLEYAVTGPIYDRSVPIEDLPPSRLIRITPEGRRDVISGEELEVAHGLLVDPKGDVFVAVNGLGIEAGKVIRYDLDGIPWNNGRPIEIAPPVRPDIPAFGTDGADTIQVETAGSRIFAKEGDDVIRAGAADEGPEAEGNVIFAGAGADVVHGGQGSDVIRGGAGDDQIFGAAFFDPALADRGLEPAALAAADAPDRIFGGEGDDEIFAEGGDDFVFGGAGDDRLFGRWGDDVIRGGDGADRIAGGVGADTQTGGAGEDIFGFGFSTAPYVLDDGVIGSFGPDTEVGEALRDVVTDFEPGTDRINVIGLQFPYLAQGLAPPELVYMGEDPFDADLAAIQVRHYLEGGSTIVELFAAYYQPIDDAYRGEVEFLGAPELDEADFILVNPML
jgi:hypothetical protein